MFRGMKLCRREVINIINAERLGFVSDVEINEKTGNIAAIIVPKKGQIFARFFGKGELVIPWKNVEVMGKEVILVRFSEFDKKQISEGL